jgi:hypothetical protein
LFRTSRFTGLKKDQRLTKLTHKKVRLNLMGVQLRRPLPPPRRRVEVAEWEVAECEVAGPIPVLLCEAHTDKRSAQNMDERWEQFGAEACVKYLEDVLGDVHEIYRGENPVAEEVGARVGRFLEDELERARLAARLAAGLPDWLRGGRTDQGRGILRGVLALWLRRMN